MGAWAGASIIASLVLFFFSTRQFALWLRALILLAAIGLLSLAGYLLATTPGDYGLFSAFADLWAHRGDVSNSVLMIALDRNEAIIDRHALPLLDLFFLVTAFVAVVAILGLTPGESIERLVRPVMLLLIGVIVGAGFALSLVAIGFGGPVKQRVYAATISAADVYDGDTLMIGDVSLRLYGADAPELEQECLRGQMMVSCGADARAELVKLVRGALVQCHAPDAGELPRESFGRPIVVCEARRGDERPIDIGATLVERGYAVPFQGGDYYRERVPYGLNAYLRDICMLRPDLWRDRSRRETFLNRGPMAEGEVIGNCQSAVRR